MRDFLEVLGHRRAIALALTPSQGRCLRGKGEGCKSSSCLVLSRLFPDQMELLSGVRMAVVF